MIDYNQQIIEKIEYLKQCYLEKDPKNADELFVKLFGKNSNPIIIGTSIDEWCFSEKEIKQLFIDDWKYWGNVSIDTQSLVVGKKSAFTWFYLKGSVEFTFHDSEERYQRYLDSVKRTAQSNKNNLAKAGAILWNLSSLLHTREQSQRKYLWDITISGLVKVDDNDVKIEAMQFSFPFASKFPDIRTDSDLEMQQKFSLEQSKINAYIRDLGLLDQTKSREKIVEFLCNEHSSILVSDDKKRYIGTNGERMNGVDFKQYLEKLTHETNVSLDNIIVKQENNSFIFCGIGEFTRSVSLDFELEQVMNQIIVNESTEPTKELLFKIRRDLAFVIREASQSDKVTFPFRIEGAGEETENGICLNYVQLSYPFYWILEQKTDAEKRL